MRQGEALYQLQQIDVALMRHRKRLQEIERELTNNEAVQAVQKRVTAAEARLKPLRSQVRDLELQSQTNREKRERTEKRLYSGTVTNPKELQDMQQEIQSLQNWSSELDDRMLEVMVAVEEAEEDLQTEEDELDKVTQEWEAAHQDLLGEKQQLEGEVAQLNSQREKALQNVTPENLKIYDRMRPQKGGQPIAVLNNGKSCSACGIEQTGVGARQIRQSDDELIECQNCGRILVYLGG